MKIWFYDIIYWVWNLRWDHTKPNVQFGRSIRNHIPNFGWIIRNRMFHLGGTIRSSNLTKCQSRISTNLSSHWANRVYKSVNIWPLIIYIFNQLKILYCASAPSLQFIWLLSIPNILADGLCDNNSQNGHNNISNKILLY